MINNKALLLAALMATAAAVTTAFVSLVVSYVDAKGGDVSLPITINGGDQRDITIHPPKEASNAG